MKLDEKEIDKLIEQVLQERDLPYTFNTTDSKIKTDLNLNKKKRAPKPAVIKQIGALDNDATDLTADDVKAAHALPKDSKGKNDPRKSALDKMIKMSNLKKAIEDVLFPLEPAKIATAGTDVDVGGTKGQIAAATPQGDNIDTQFAQVYGAHNDQADPIPGIDLDYFALSGKENSGQIAANFKGRMKESTAEIFKAEISKHGTLIDMFDHYQLIGKAVNDANNAAEAAKAIDTYMTGPPAYSAADIYNSLQVMTELESITNDFHGVASGYGFEKLIALMSAGVVFGGDNKAADNLAQVITDPNSEVMLMSSKSAQGSVASQTQSESTIQDLDIGKTMYYLAFQRGKSTTSKAGQSTVVKIYGIGIRRVEGAGGRAFLRSEFRYVDPNTGQVIDAIKWGNMHDNIRNRVGNKDGKVIMPVQNYPFNIEIPVLRLGKTVTALASVALQEVSDDSLKQIELIQRNVAVLKEKTQVFVALQKRNKKTESIKASGEAGGAFITLRDSLQGKGYVMDTETKSQFNESKFASLDQLIAETIRDIKKSKK